MMLISKATFARTGVNTYEAPAVGPEYREPTVVYTAALEQFVSKPATDERFDLKQQAIRMNYIALMPDGGMETVVDGQVVYRSRPDPALVQE